MGDLTPLPDELKQGAYLWKGHAGYEGEESRVVAHDPLNARGWAEFLDIPEVRYTRWLMPAVAHVMGLGKREWIDRGYYTAFLLFAGRGRFFSHVGVWLGRPRVRDSAVNHDCDGPHDGQYLLGRPGVRRRCGKAQTGLALVLASRGAGAGGASAGMGLPGCGVPRFAAVETLGKHGPGSGLCAAGIDRADRRAARGRTSPIVD